MPHLSIATWNINSVRLRVDLVARFVAEQKLDVMCLQEIKCRNGEFPEKAFKEMGLKHLHVVGQKGWHGVAIASKHKLEPLDTPALCPRGEARVAAARVKDIDIHNLYVPAGGDEPDPAINEKFAHKLAVVEAMRKHYRHRKPGPPIVLVGDLNIAPGEHDVWSHKQLLDVVSHTPVETEGLETARTQGGFVDLARHHRPAPEKLFTWWSYRSPDWTKNDRGRRLDHIWATPDIAAKTDRFEIFRDCRAWEKPSDHVPVMVRVKL
jgi:exodeoxyribonuclease-3